MKKIGSCLCQALAWCCGLLSVSPSAIGQNLVLNGSFESGAFTGTYYGNAPLDAGSAAVSDWTVVNSDILWIDNSSSDAAVFNCYASDGERYLELTGFDQIPFGGIEQSIPTQTGMRYLLAFDLGTNPARLGGTQTLIAQAGTAQSSFTFTGVGDSSQYIRYGLSFVADSSTTLIRFTGSTPSGFNIGLDNVVVSPVPEPGPSTLMIVGVVVWSVRQHFRATQFVCVAVALEVAAPTFCTRTAGERRPH